MRVGIATDHGGFSLKEELVTRLGAADLRRLGKVARMEASPSGGAGRA